MNFFKVKKEHLNDWTNAMFFLLQHFSVFPEYSDETITDCIFKNWRFVVTGDHELVFADGILPAITKEDFISFRRVNS